VFKFKSGVKNCKDSNKLDYKLIADTYKTSYKHTTEHPDNSEEGNHIYLIFNRAVGNFVNINVFFTWSAASLSIPFRLHFGKPIDVIFLMMYF